MAFDTMDREELYITAQLARLELPRQEADNLERAVSQMLDYFAKMKELDVEGLAPTSQMAQDNRLRKDTVTESQAADEILINAPELENRFIVIPNVL